MFKTLRAAAAALLLAVGAYGESEANNTTHFYGFADRYVSGTNCIITNDVDYAWKPGSVSFYVTNQALANVFTTERVHYTDETHQYLGEVLVTNSFGFIETNVYHTITNSYRVTMTNVPFSTTTNLQHNFYDQDDLGDNFYIQPGDLYIMRFSTYSNFWLHFVYLR